MGKRKVLNIDLAGVMDAKGGRLTTLGWGDVVDFEKIEGGKIVINAFTNKPAGDGTVPDPKQGFIKVPAGMKAEDVLVEVADNKVMRLNFIDVQQGDAAVLETPKGKVMLVDGGDNVMFARYLASRFRGTSDEKRKTVEAIVVTHGDADHFAGLTEIFNSETNKTPEKRLFIHPKRIFHNGITKTPSKEKADELEKLNKVVEVDGKHYVQLVDDLTKMQKDKLNKPFNDWVAAIKAWRKDGDIDVRRLQLGDDKAFGFLGDGIRVEVLGPLVQDVKGKPSLPFLGEPPKGPRIGHASLDVDDGVFKGHSASHTINGHSIVLRVIYGDFAFLLTGDLNDQAARQLVLAHRRGDLNLRADVLKAPHHGSHEFSSAFLEAVAPTVSVISSGDESAQKEYMHPRATLVGALGRYSPSPEPIVLCTELVAFFQLEGWSCVDKCQDSDVPKDHKFKLDDKQPRYYGFNRTRYGLVKMRTDGKRLLVYTNSGRDDLKEAYAYQLDSKGVLQPSPIRKP